MDRTSFTRLLHEHKDAVYGLAVQLLRNRDDAEDVVQEVFLKLWRKGDEVETASCGVWLMRVCRNACLDRFRRQRVRLRHTLGPAATVQGVRSTGDGEGQEDEDSFDLSDEGAGARRIEHETESHEVVAAMRELDEPQRSVILLREVHHLSYEEIAQVTGMSLGAVKVSLHRARRRVRHRLGEPMEARA